MVHTVSFEDGEWKGNRITRGWTVHKQIHKYTQTHEHKQPPLSLPPLFIRARKQQKQKHTGNTRNRKTNIEPKSRYPHTHVFSLTHTHSLAYSHPLGRKISSHVTRTTLTIHKHTNTLMLLDSTVTHEHLALAGFILLLTLSFCLIDHSCSVRLKLLSTHPPNCSKHTPVHEKHQEVIITA